MVSRQPLLFLDIDVQSIPELRSLKQIISVVHTTKRHQVRQQVEGFAAQKEAYQINKMHISSSTASGIDNSSAHALCDQHEEWLDRSLSPGFMRVGCGGIDDNVAILLDTGATGLTMRFFDVDMR